jgi:RNA recognition motif-containing protein
MTSIFVAKLDFNATDDQLRSLFEQYGKVNRVTIAKDRETGKPRGFAFVEMFNEGEAEAAISALDNSTVNGRSIAVKKADDRGSKPGGAPGQRPERSDRPQRPDGNRFDNRQGRPDGNRFENRPPRTDSAPRTGDERPPFRQPDDNAASKPAFDDKPFKTERKKEKKDPSKKSLSDQPKQQKMEAYKKSGKANRFFEMDDEDDEDWAYQSKRSSGWDEEE